MNKLECSTVLDLLPLYVDGLLSPQSRALVQAHLAECGSCRKTYERMSTEVQENTEKDAGKETDSFERSLKKLRRKISRRTVCSAMIALAVGVCVCLLILWQQGVFYRAQVSTSPDGTITATAYSALMDGVFPRAGGCTFKTEGDFTSTVMYPGSEVDGMWWSPNSRYLLAQTRRGEEIYLSLMDFQNSNSSNLVALFNLLTGNASYLDGVRENQDGELEICYQFVQWSTDSSTMLIYYTAVDEQGVDRAGYFWYDIARGSAQACMELNRFTAQGRILQAGQRMDGTTFYVMENGLDENGNVQELVVEVTEATQLRGSDGFAEGDEIYVVYGTPGEKGRVDAISITLVSQVN